MSWVFPSDNYWWLVSLPYFAWAKQWSPTIALPQKKAIVEHILWVKDPQHSIAARLVLNVNPLTKKHKGHQTFCYAWRSFSMFNLPSSETFLQPWLNLCHTAGRAVDSISKIQLMTIIHLKNNYNVKGILKAVKHMVFCVCLASIRTGSLAISP